MQEGIIIRLPVKNLLLSRKKDNLYLSDTDMSGSRLILHGCSEHFDAAVSKDGIIYIVCGNGNDTVLFTCSGDEIEAQKPELPAGSSNYRLHLVGRVLSLGFTAPMGGGQQGLYHVLPQTGDEPELLGRCSSSARPFSSAADNYGNIIFVFATHDACICGKDYIWSKKTFGKQYTIGTHFTSASSPHVIVDGGRIHCAYIAKDKEGSNLMYYNDNINRPETVFEGCYAGGMPVLVRINEQVNIVWNQYGTAMLADTWHGKVSKIEEKKYFSEPSLIGIRLPEPLEDYCCSEIFARGGAGGFRPVVGEDIITEDISHLLNRKVIIPGEEAEKLFNESFAQELKKNSGQAETALKPSDEIAQEEMVKEKPTPAEEELKLIGTRVERLEKAVEGAAIVIDETVKQLYTLNGLQGEIKQMTDKIFELREKIEALTLPADEIKIAANTKEPPAAAQPKKRGTRKKKDTVQQDELTGAQ